MSGAANFQSCGSVLVTGASRGLGLQLVESLAAGGFSPGRIIATSRNPAAAQKLQELAEKHPNVHIVSLDVLSQESIERSAEEVGRLLGDDGLNCLINNAGINVVADFHSVTAEKMIENFHTNAVAPLMVTKAFVPLLKKAASRGGGGGGGGAMGIHRAAVINVTSLLGSVELNWGDRGDTFKWYPYRTSKSALNMVSRCMAVDLGPDGILCMAIHPGWVRTDMGGPEAPLSSEESVDALLSVLGGLSDKDHGCFLNFTGEQLPCLSRRWFQVDGSIRFSVFFDRQLSRLEVRVLQVEGLQEARPFVRLLLTSAEPQTQEDGEAASPVLRTVLQEWRTGVVKGSRSALFGEQFSCILRADGDKLRHVNLRMEVRDFDKFSRHAVLGEVRVPLGHINICYPVELHRALQVPHKDVVGEVLLSLKFLPVSQRLEVGLLKIRTLPAEGRCDAALHARIGVQCNRSRLRYQKTSAAARSPVAVFNRVLVFRLPEPPVERCRVSLHLYETPASDPSAKRLIGQLSLGKERQAEHEHWTLMMRSLRQPVARWHGLLI